MQRDADSVADIVIAARRAIGYVGELSRSDLEDDELRSSAVIRQLEIVGEAASRVAEDFRKAHPDVPWRKMVGMRNILIHAYNRVDLAEVWSVVVDEFPTMIKALEALLPPPPED